MPRTARVVVAAEPHHVTQRGNNRQSVFSNDRDHLRYLRFLRQESDRHGLRTIGFCLMPNHVHLVVIPERTDSLAKAIGRAHYAYTFSCRTAYGFNGHLWQNRYYSTPLDPDHLVAALAYVDLNPVRANIVNEPEDFTWSSARAHLSATGRPRHPRYELVARIRPGIRLATTPPPRRCGEDHHRTPPRNPNRQTSMETTPKGTGIRACPRPTRAHRFLG